MASIPVGDDGCLEGGGGSEDGESGKKSLFLKIIFIF